MNAFRLSTLVVSLLLACSAAAQTVTSQLDPSALRSRQQAQQRAREMARELVSTILDVQLQQLAENGLTEMPLFKDITSMRQNIDGLVEAEMLEVVSLLEKAQQAEPEGREVAFRESREKIREVVVRLAAERQNLLRRLKTAELVAQVKRLIGQETAVLAVTESLPEQPQTKQETLAIDATEDQEDIKRLFFVLVETLSEVRDWGGPVSSGASDGLRLLKVARVGQELDVASANLEKADFATAAESQKQVIRGLRSLLEKLEETQGLIGADREAALEMVRELLKRQEAIRSKTSKQDLSAPEAESLVEEQAAIRKDLGKLSEGLEEVPSTLPLAEQAKAAAYEATGKLFEARAEEAMAEQGKVLGSLAQIEEQLLNDVDLDRSDKSAEEFAKLVRDLEKTQAELKQAKTSQERANAAVQTRPADATAPEQQVAKTLTKAAAKKLPAGIQSRLAEAEEAATEAAAALADSEEEKTTQQEKVETASDALDAAAAEVEAALADARRRQLAVEVGELARAAETLERAAAAEREVASAAKKSSDEGLAAEEAAELANEQEEIKQIAAKVAAGVKLSAPEAAKKLREAATPIAAAAQQLAAAEKMPGAASKPAASKAAEQTDMGASRLTEAAAELRKQIGQTASKLATVSKEQLGHVETARSAVEKSLAERPKSLAERIERLSEAEAKVDQAFSQQQRAAGRPGAAAAMELAEKIKQAMVSQQKANLAARTLAQGKANTPFDAATSQEQVAEQAGKLLEEAASRPAARQAKEDSKVDPLAEALQAARESASRAAQQTLDGRSAQAEAARKQTRAALKQAQELAAAEVEQAMTAPPGEPDAALQADVGKSTGEAEVLAAEDAPLARETLGKASAKSKMAEENAQARQIDAARTSQSETASNLDTARGQLRDARKSLANQEGRQLAQQAAEAARLADQTAAVDSGATSALQSAEKMAQAAADDMSDMEGMDDMPMQAGSAAEQLERALQRAAANLNSREQRIRRDQAIAEALARLAGEQQQAAEQIDAQRHALTSLQPDNPENAPQSPGADKPAGEPAMDNKSEAAQRAAQKLAQATSQFAEAQRITGQGAQEISGQQQLANVPLREALELASNLNTAMPASDAEAMPMDGAPPSPQPAESNGQPSPGEASAAESQGKPAPPAGQPGEKGEGQAGEPSQAGQAGQQGQPMEGQSGQPMQQGQPGQAQTASNPSMGTGFVPNSPQVTAQMMAGPEAMAQLAALGQMPPSPSAGQGQPSQGPPSGQTQPGEAQGTPMPSEQAQGKPGQQNPMSPGGTSKDGKLADNEAVKDGPLELSPGAPDGNDSRTAGDVRDSDATARGVSNDPWVAKLPPELRAAIRAKAQRRPPRSYEERLRRYFENIE
jgi:hypothetical protein